MLTPAAQQVNPSWGKRWRLDQDWPAAFFRPDHCVSAPSASPTAPSRDPSAQFQEKCFAKMREFQANGTTIVLLSHALDMVQEFGQRVLIVDGGQVVAVGDTR